MSQSSHVGPRPRPTGSQPKTAGLRDCLDHQYSAVTTIARVANITPANATPALQFTARAAARLCHASTARVLIVDGRELRLAALFPPAQDPTRQRDWLASVEDLARR